MKGNDMAAYYSIKQTAQGEIEEKKSRFIATIRPVETKEEAEQFIAACKKKYPDARHNCSAYILGAEGQIEHSSDDGEPAGTAGRPMLEVLRGEKLTNVCVVVTRYFGGILLGTGGLVRAYTQSVKAGIENSQIIKKVKGTRFFFSVSYTDVGKLQYFIRQNNYILEDMMYAVMVDCIVLVEEERVSDFLTNLRDVFSGRIEIADKEELVYAVDVECQVIS